MVAWTCSKVWVALLLCGLICIAAPSLAAPSSAAPRVAARKAPVRLVKGARLIKGLMLGAALFTALPMHPGMAAPAAEAGCQLPATVATVLAEKLETKHLPFMLRVPGRALSAHTYGELMHPQVRLEGDVFHVQFSPKTILQVVTHVPETWRVTLSVPAEQAAPVVKQFADHMTGLANGVAIDKAALQKVVHELTPMLDFGSLRGDQSSKELAGLLTNFAGVDDAHGQLTRCVDGVPAGR